jgi:hypothetical protein
VLILVALLATVVVVEALRRSAATGEGTEIISGSEPGSIPIYQDGQAIGSFSPADLEHLDKVSFVDDEEGKTQEGWLLRDMLLLHVEEGVLQASTDIVVSSSSREKAARLTWAEVEDPDNWVMFDLSGRGTLKLVSVLERLDIRDEWIQDVDRIEITSP